MLWDEGFESWQHFGIRGQPAFAMLTPDGQVVDSWYGGLDDDKILELADRHRRA